MSDKFTESLIDSSELEGLISSETRSRMIDMLEFEDRSRPQPRREKAIIQSLSAHTSPPHPIAAVPSQMTSPVPSLITVAERILQDLESNLSKLYTLNPSRRESIAHHLNRLSGLGPASPSGTSRAEHSSPSLMKPGLPSATNGLQRWVDGPRSPAQNAAIRAYFEEVATIALGQAILLKTWSDRGLRKWTESDLGRLNWALSTALKPHVPLDREGWQITRPNLYSWYNPSPVLQHEIWLSLEEWRITDEGPGFLLNLLSPLRRTQPENQDPHGYDPRFYHSLWKQIQRFGFQSQPPSDSHPSRRNKVVFSPTLRDGSLVRSAPENLSWVGLESSPFQLMLAELMQIWWGPAPPPLWSVGTGLEVHARDQLAFALCSSKPSVVNRIAEMEACDAAFVLEEQIVRTSGRSTSGHRFRETVESLPYFKKLKAPGTSQGALQACVALTKLRPGGILWWAREEALSAKDGHEMLNFLLERAKILCEWDFSDLSHTLPSTVPVFPKHLYLLQKEPNIELRLSHRPIRHSIQGQLRSHVELELMLEDSLKSAVDPAQVLPRGQWKVLSHLSPTLQREWVEKWPDPASQTVVRELDQLRMESLPLANFTTIRHAPDPESARRGNWSLHLPLRGFWLTSEYDSEGRRLVARPLPKNVEEMNGAGYLILVPDESWVTPLATYAMSPSIQKWLDYHAERRGERWVLNEQVVKWLPIPKSLLRALGVPSAKEGDSEASQFAHPLPGEWERLAAEVSYQPKGIKEVLAKLPEDTDSSRIHATIFVRTSRALEYLMGAQQRLFSMVTPEGQVRWRELLQVLPKTECVPVTLHPKVRLSGSLPAHLPIDKIDRVRSPSTGILLATESGFTLHIGTENPLLTQMLWDQMEGVTHPTWSELVQFLSLPRKIELAEATALDVLRSHEEQMSRYKELRELLAECKLH